MVFASVLALVTLLTPAQDDPREVVAKLNSPKSAERSSAEARLEALGDAAVPALVEATDSSDLELRHRAAAFLDRLEGRRLSLPTLVPLNFRAKPLREVAETVGRSAGITIVIEPDADAKIRERPITLRSDGPLPLWAVVDRLCASGGLRLDPPTSPWMRQRQVFAMGGNPQLGRMRIGGGNELVFRPDDSKAQVPTSDSGAFRVSVAGLMLDRTRNFIRSPESPGKPETVTQFTLTLQVRGEPRLTIASIEEPRLIEAIDDRGQSLLSTAIVPTPRMPNRGMGEMNLNPPLTFSLKYPDMPGRSIARFRGTLRGLVVGRRGDPIVIPLEKSEGKTFTSGPTSLTVQSFRQAGPGRETTLDFTLEGVGGGNGSQPMFNALDPRSGLRPPAAAGGQVEFLDAKGRICHVADLGGFNGNFGVGNQRKIVFVALPTAGPPVEARYHGAIWSTVEIPFDFRDIPMP